VDAGNHRVQALGRDGRFIRTMGSDTSDVDRRLNHPSDVAIDSPGGVYVADRENQRVQAYDSDGAWRRSWGSYGYHPGLFASAAGVAAGRGFVFVADAMNHRIQVFRPDGELVYAWGRHVAIPHEGQGRLHYPARIALSTDGARAAVVETFENRVQVFGELGPEDRDPGRVGGSAETGTLAHYGQRVAAHGKRIVVTEPESHALLVFDTSRPEPINIGRWGAYGRKFGEFGTPTALAWEPSGDAIVAAELALARLQTFRIGAESDKVGFSPTLARFSRAIELASLGVRAEWPLSATAMRFDTAGNLYVLDARNARIWVFDREYKLLRACGAHGDAAGELREPTDLAVADDGSHVWVVDAGHRRLLCFDANGALAATAPAGATDAAALVDPFGVTIGADGVIYVSDAGADCIRVFSRDGADLRRWGRRGLDAGEFFKPAGLAFDRSGRLFVVDWGNHRLQSFTPEGEFVGMFGARQYTQAARRRTPQGGE
ncbi:MAG: NHL repeat-containing protein, partial [Phycisphaerae bacterium]